MPDDESTLLPRMHAGDSAAARSLWNNHAPRLLALARAMCRGPGARGAASGLADDAVQNAFLGLLKLDTRSINAIRDVRAYLAQAVRAAVLNAQRTERRETARRGALLPPGTGSVDVPDHLSDAIDALPEAQRDVILLKHVAGLTFDQMSLATGEPRATLASRHAAALRLLRAAMDPAALPPSSGVNT